MRGKGGGGESGEAGRNGRAAALDGRDLQRRGQAEQGKQQQREELHDEAQCEQQETGGPSTQSTWFTTHAKDRPLLVQLGGNDPMQLAVAARMGEEAGFCEINLNCGCP